MTCNKSRAGGTGRDTPTFKLVRCRQSWATAGAGDQGRKGEGGVLCWSLVDLRYVVLCCARTLLGVSLLPLYKDIRN